MLVLQPLAAHTNSYVTQHADPIFFNMARRGTRFCCCAFPLVKFGAYLLVIETAFVALCLGILALAPPPIVGGMAVSYTHLTLPTIHG